MSIILVRHKFNKKWLSKHGWTNHQKRAFIYHGIQNAMRRVQELNMTNLVIYEEYSVRLRKTYEDKNFCE